MAESKRSFLALRFSQEVNANLVRLQQELKSQWGDRAKIKWVAAENIHLTLQFLGQVEGDLLALLAEELSGSFAHIPAFEVSLQGLGAFPRPQRPRVVWLGFDQGGRQMEDVFRAVERVTEACGFKPETRAFRPHLTLGRIKVAKQASDISKLIERFQDHHAGKCQIAAVELLASELRPEGPIYTRLDSFPLGGYDTEHLNR